MSFPIDFQRKTIYPSLDIGITIEAILRYGNLQTECSAKVDTGAQSCIFERGVADSLGIDVESGYREKFLTLGLRFQSYVYFTENYAVNRNPLGRQGWLQLIKLGLDDYKSEIYLSPNQE